MDMKSLSAAIPYEWEQNKEECKQSTMEQPASSIVYEPL